MHQCNGDVGIWGDGGDGGAKTKRGFLYKKAAGGIDLAVAVRAAFGCDYGACGYVYGIERQ